MEVLRYKYRWPSHVPFKKLFPIIYNQLAFRTDLKKNIFFKSDFYYISYVRILISDSVQSHMSFNYFFIE